jgi:putative flippase GtrA
MSLISRILTIYLSTQFLKYLVCGVLSSLVHIIARWVLSHYIDFGWAVFFSYFIGMPVALVLYRMFVFNGRGGSVVRQFVLFSLTYFGFLPLTWLLSVASAPNLEMLMPTANAQLVAHMIGILGPVVLNFAYNKFITFSEQFEPEKAAAKPGLDP